jgi:hypothetical protein
LFGAPDRLKNPFPFRGRIGASIGEVKYKDEILPGEQPAIMDRQLFDAVQQKLTDQWSHRNHAKSKSDHLLTGLLYDDAGHRMIPTHATKAGIRYRYYVSLPHLKGESKTISHSPSSPRISSERRSKAVCSAASESNDFVMLLQNGAGSSRRSD